jgi:catechol 2,3-dioxygenase-like lactoylglutathione lyase family enzyme
MQNLNARAVFFVKDAEHSLKFYTEELGFSQDWNYKDKGRAFVFQVSLFGFELILNQAEAPTRRRVGHGRVFIGLDDDQAAVLLEHIKAKDIETSDFHWGAPTLVIKDLDNNELFFWLPQ